MTEVEVLRIGHRLVRDDRVTTHAALVARAFGAKRIHLVGVEPEIVGRVRDVVDRWGGDFEASLLDDWRGYIRDWKDNGGLTAHLTMYGVGIDEVLEAIRRAGKKILVIVGAEKVPAEVFKMSDYNIAVGSQPHSEVAALAVFLDRLFQGEELKQSFANYRIRILPSQKEKKVEVVSNEDRV